MTRLNGYLLSFTGQKKLQLNNQPGPPGPMEVDGMRPKTRFDSLIKCYGITGVKVEINSPGDGYTRYNVFMPGSKPGTYGRQLADCKGLEEFRLFCQGFEAGRKTEQTD